MPDKPNGKAKTKASEAGSGVLPRPVLLESHSRHEPPMPPTLPEVSDDNFGATGVMSIVPEGSDDSAEREDDPASNH